MYITCIYILIYSEKIKALKKSVPNVYKVSSVNQTLPVVFYSMYNLNFINTKIIGRDRSVPQVKRVNSRLPKLPLVTCPRSHS